MSPTLDVQLRKGRNSPYQRLQILANQQVWWGWEKFKFRKFEVVSDSDQAFGGAV